jgi:hypothetical protein
LKKAQRKASANKPKPIAKRIEVLAKKLARAKNPVRRAALKKALTLAKKVSSLRKALKRADPV